MSSARTRTDQVVIYVQKEGPFITEIYDTGDQCMKAAVASFEILSDLHNASESIGSPKIILHLTDFAGDVKYMTEDGMELLDDCDPEVDAIYLATKSVLKYLHAAELVGKDTILFRAVRGSHEERNLSVSRLFVIALEGNDECPLYNYKEGIISRTYAYLSEKEVCMFLNDSSQETLQKLDTVLEKLFPRVESPSADPIR